MATLILMRHGHVEGIYPERFRGRAELPLSALGVRQAQALADRLSVRYAPVALYTSPMGRCSNRYPHLPRHEYSISAANGPARSRL
ncbi:probable phosphoglycerate mutase [Nitrosovibrio tenuis]|uniref:Probable phosphoglycerate mutase n=1 Tax=Nitrosovibrio tenuis TaxID=1233 RepID=A0A1H7Q1G9_9PROT|nr:probable phosphoglycerate mutase [Nitrosovibrio tenuis]